MPWRNKVEVRGKAEASASIYSIRKCVMFQLKSAASFRCYRPIYSFDSYIFFGWRFFHLFRSFVGFSKSGPLCCAFSTKCYRNIWNRYKHLWFFTWISNTHRIRLRCWINISIFTRLNVHMSIKWMYYFICGFTQIIPYDQSNWAFSKCEAALVYESFHIDSVKCGHVLATSKTILIEYWNDIVHRAIAQKIFKTFHHI